MSNVRERLARELEAMPEAVAESSLAGSALVLAGLLDGPGSPSSKALVQKEYRETLAQLRELAPPKVEEDEIERARKRRERRLAGKPAAGASSPS